MTGEGERGSERRQRCGASMSRITLLLMVSIAGSAFGASAQDHGRIKRKPPSAMEAERIASDMAMNDSLLRKGDIVATDRGFFIFRGLAPDGITGDFLPVPDPATWDRKKPAPRMPERPGGHAR
jgi:hypothetical protein